MKIDIIIPCYEKTAILEKCLAALKENTKNYNLILIKGKRSAAANRNIGLKKVKLDWFVMMDDDVIATKNWLNILLKCRKKDIGQIQPKILLPDGKIFSAELKLEPSPHPEGYKEEDMGQYDYILEAEMLAGTCGLYSSKILKKCKFDETFKGSQHEDIDFSMQIKKAGFKLLYCGKSSVYHYNLKRLDKSEKNFALLKKKWLDKND